MNKMKIPYLNPAQQDTACFCSLDEIVKAIQIGEISNHIYLNSVLEIRELYQKLKKNEISKQQYQETKFLTLPNLIPSAAMHYSKLNTPDDIIEYNYLLCVDLDGLDDKYDKIYSLIKNDRYTKVMFRSPGGNGIKIFILLKHADFINKNQILRFHKAAFTQIQEYFLKTFNKKIDDNCSNINRGCFLSFDPDIFVNDNAETFQVDWDINDTSSVVKPTKIKDPFLEILYQYCFDHKIILSQSYNDWIRFGWSLYSDYCKLNEVQTKYYFHLFSSIDQNKYDSEDCEKKINELIKMYKSEYRYCFKDYIKIAIEKGFEVPKGFKSNVELYSTDTFSLLNSLGVEHSLDVLLGGEYLTFPNLNYNKEIITDRLLDDLYTNFMDLTGLKLQQGRLYSYFNSNSFCKKINPVQDLLDSIETSNESQFIKMLSGIETINITEKMKYDYIMKWMLQVFDNLYTMDFGKHILIFKGPQDLGKTYFIKNLFLKIFCKLKIGNSEKDLGLIDTSFTWSDTNKDNLSKLTKSIFLFDDELCASKKVPVEDIKRMTSMTSFSYRRPYGKVEEAFKRISSFLGATNSSNIYNDLSGGVRFFILDIIKMNREILNSVNYEAVWGYVFWYWKNRCKGYQYNLDKNEHDKNVENYRTISNDEDIFNEFIVKDLNGMLTRNDIIDQLQRLTNRDYERILSPTGLGRLMTRLNIESKRIKNNSVTVYQCRVEKLDKIDMKNVKLDDDNHFHTNTD
jgi:hypothetical protein